MTGDDFFALAGGLCDGLSGTERLFCGLHGEDSDFVRLNRNRIRQAGSVHRSRLMLTLIDRGRQLVGYCDLSGRLALDRSVARSLLQRLRAQLAHLPEDPFVNYAAAASTSECVLDGRQPDPAEAVDALIAAAGDLDLVGIWASGDIVQGLVSSVGHRHWHRSRSFHLDWSCYLTGDKAVKDGYSGFDWDPAAVHAKLDRARADLALMARPARTLFPGRYRAYLAPAAVEELVSMLAWGGFGLKSHRTTQTPLLALAEGRRALDRRVTIREEHDRGLVSGFTATGFTKPNRVDLVVDGAYRDCLVDARSGKEYRAEVNAASEYPHSLAVDPGDIPRAAVLERLGTGLYIGNLWYLNYADRNDCRVTGMTRFGTFWVEQGRPVAPVEVMRFDDSIYRLLGERLEGLTRERELLLSASTYDGRSTASMLLPGVLVDGIELTL